MRGFIFTLILCGLWLSLPAQPVLKIASTRYHGLYSYFPGLSDSTAYYYDAEGVLRSSVVYYLPHGEAIYKPHSMIVFPETAPNITTKIYYKYDMAAATWSKWNMITQTILDGGNEEIQEGFSWNEKTMLFESYSKSRRTRVFQGGKLVRTEEERHSESVGASKRIIERQDFEYDSNDSLAFVLYSAFRSDSGKFISQGMASYQYIRSGNSDFVIHRSINGGDTVITTIEHRSGGHVVSVRGLRANGRVTSFDSSAFDANGFKVYSESAVYELSGAYYSRTKNSLTPDDNGRLKITEHQSWNVKEDKWNDNKYYRSEYQYSNSGSLVGVLHYVWMPADAAWKFSWSQYEKFNSAGLPIESGSFDGSDTQWLERHYYAPPLQKYTPFKGLTVLLSPNPGGSSVTARVYAEDYHTLDFSFMDMAGRVLWRREIVVAPGPGNIVLIPGKVLRYGCYLYEVYDREKGESVTGKFMVLY